MLGTLSMSHKRAREESSPSSNAPLASEEHQIWSSSSPIYDRQSSFIGYFSPTMRPKALQNHLRSLNKNEPATHYILAWRTPHPQKGTLTDHFQPSRSQEQPPTFSPRDSSHANARGNATSLDLGSDDDGERYGGRHVLKVLEQTNVQGSLVVARWYGGIMLGPVRFGHMEEAARAAIKEWQRATGEAQGIDPKRLKGSDTQEKKAEEEEKARLVKELTQRDLNIIVLRDLLRDKKAVLSKTETKANQETSNEVGASQPSPSPAKKTDYAAMTLESLQRMDKARDSTVAFLLKKIEELEESDKTGK